jgi:hypothetical protein
LLNDQQTAVNFRMQQMVATVQLIKALGGGWNAAQIPSAHEVGFKISPASRAKSESITEPQFSKTGTHAPLGRLIRPGFRAEFRVCASDSV